MVESTVREKFVEKNWDYNWFELAVAPIGKTKDDHVVKEKVVEIGGRKFFGLYICSETSTRVYLSEEPIFVSNGTIAAQSFYAVAFDQKGRINPDFVVSSIWNNPPKSFSPPSQVPEFQGKHESRMYIDGDRDVKLVFMTKPEGNLNRGTSHVWRQCVEQEDAISIVMSQAEAAFSAFTSQEQLLAS
ncbi:hypothetical protein CO051_00510 [Candidatus Roizmanbacteria bacterium CG_4_9_14_0_2_um_filter_39_13]|uniref:Uncharacterized protein n=1 Tax=Candidatus Roizmanbacteria bacterium CG_4_9_14_0_2_um_filter_39_13 TaxID=1974839 RepID=A0A2M8F463_9BACT|nr:MAG: hypothetical protein COY15_03780 [Candidatus Roizmanbacteria bacterium CG_4_10_14_0_2_um_filter_39_12]PJC34041.1 MAG: hypothetical protein CO051_00510 [Candidatus Roizmanbacteria bacterium CG_4_9_14_0_2_um_filter_39_13]